MKHIMVDLETMGTRPDSAIVAIGAVEFDPEDGGKLDKIGGADYFPELGREFYQVVNLQSSIDAGLVVQGHTVYWWLEQSEDARKALLQSQVPLGDALIGLELFWKQTGAEYIWGHGPSFDIAILNTAYLNLFGKHPWKYNAARDTRTIYDAADLWPSTEHMKKVNGLAHHALEDAKAQARYVIEARAKLQEMRAALTELDAAKATFLNEIIRRPTPYTRADTLEIAAAIPAPDHYEPGVALLRSISEPGPAYTPHDPGFSPMPEDDIPF